MARRRRPSAASPARVRRLGCASRGHHSMSPIGPGGPVLTCRLGRARISTPFLVGLRQAEVCMRATRSLVLIVSLLSLASPATSQPAAPRVSAFSPQGTVKGVRQAQAVFSAPMVAFGDLRRPDPFEVECPEAGTGRWVDTSIWVYDFARDLPAGVRCSFKLRAGLTSLDGRTLSGATQFAFSTGGPALTSSQPSEGSDSIDEDQAFVLELDAPA